MAGVLNKFTTILHQAVEAFAPTLPLQQEFVGHWKAVTNYFIENKNQKVSVDQTNIPGHLEEMIKILHKEESDLESGSTGPCMEYMLQHRILETLYTLARTDCPPGMKQKVLQFFTKLLSRTRQPLLPHVNVYKAVHRLIRVCGEVQAGPSETEEIQFLCTVCGKLRQDPYLVNFFIESVSSKDKSAKVDTAAGNSQSAKPGTMAFTLIDSLLNLMHSADARVAVKACEGLMLCAGLPEKSSTSCIAHHTRFCQELTNQLCKLYTALPKAMDPADIECVEAKWGLDILCATEDHLNFPGKRKLISFLSWLDYCDQLCMEAHPVISEALAASIRTQLLEAVLEPAVMQTSEAGATTAMAHLSRCIRLVSSKAVLKDFIHFTLGEDPPVKTAGENQHKLRHRLLERCNHLSEEMSITALKVFESLLQKSDPSIVHTLVLKNLLGRSYFLPPAEESESQAENQSEQTAQSSTSAHNGPVQSPDSSESSAGQNGQQSEVVDPPAEVGSGDGAHVQESSQIADSPGSPDSLTDPFDLGLQSSPRASDINPAVHTVVNSFLCLVPEEIKSSYHMADSGYDQYLRDANRQFSDISSKCQEWGWPDKAFSDPDYHSDNFHEGSFLKMLLDKLAHMLDQSYDINLQVTSVISRLAMLPHPNLNEYLLNPFLPLQDGVRTVSTVLQKVVHDVQVKQKNIPGMTNKLMVIRRQLMGLANNIRRQQRRSTAQRMESDNMLEGVIVLEEFCKELAAIAFVKYHAVAMQ